MPSNYGLVVEGDYDKVILHELVTKIRSENLPIYCRICSGLGELRKNYPGLLRDLEHAHHGNSVDKVLVIRDADGKDPEDAEADLARQIANHEFSFRFGVSFFAIRQKVETLLLADSEAINAVAESRGVLRRRVDRPREPLEDIADPKVYFREMLSEVGLRYTGEVCRLIAARADLNIIKRFCPSFERFITKVTLRVE